MIATLHRTGRRLEELTAGEVDAVADRDGGTFMLRRAQDRLRLSDAASKAAILNALPAHIALIDTQGLIVSANDAWRRFVCTGAVQGPGHATGLNYLDICDGARGDDSSGARQVAEGIRSVLDGSERSFSIEYPCHSSTEQRWFLMTAAPLAGERPTGAVVMHLDITQRKRAADELHESERRFSHLLGNIEMVSLMLDTDGNITYSNDYLLRLTGWWRAEIIGKNWFKLFLPPDEGESRRTHAALLANQPEAWHHENEIVTRSGERRLIRWNNSVLKSAAGGVTGTASIGEDITDQKLAEVRIKHLNRVYVVLSGINTLIVRVGSHEELYREACRIAVENGGFRMAMIALLDRDTKQIVPVASAGKDEGLLTAVKHVLSSGEHAAKTMVARAIREKQPVVSNDSPADPQVVFGKNYAECEVRSMAVFPLLVEDAAIGVLALYSPETGFFHTEEMKLLNELAGDIAFAIDHIGKVAKLARLSRIQAVLGSISALIVRARGREELFSEACRIAVEDGKFGIAWIGAFDPATLDVTPVAWAGFDAREYLGGTKATTRTDLPQGQGALGRAIRELKPVFDNDISIDTGVGNVRRAEALRRGYRSLIVLPLTVAGVAVGNLSLFAREPNFFDEEELRLLTELAGDLSFALENLDRQQKLDKLSRIRAVSSEVNAAIIRVKDRQALLDAACNIAVEQAGLPLAWIGMLDPATADLKPAAHAGTVPEYAKLLAPSIHPGTAAGQGTNGRAFRESRPVVDNDMTADLDMGFARKVGLEHGIQAGMSLPLLVDGLPVGVMGLYSREKNYFDEQETTLLTEVAGNISFALEQLAKQQKLDKLSRIRAVSSETNAAIVRIRDRKELLEAACRIVSEHGQFGMVWIAALDHAAQQVRPIAWTGFSVETAHAVDWASIATSKGTIGEAIQSRLPSVRYDIQDALAGGRLREQALQLGCRSSVCLPLIVDDCAIAVLVLFAAGKGFFDSEEVALLNEVAGNISFALANIGKQEKLTRLARIRAISSEINTAIVRIHDRKALLRETCRIAVEHGKFELVWIALLDHEKQLVEPVAWAGFSSETAHLMTWASFSTPAGTLAEVGQTGTVAIRNDIEAEPPVGVLRQEALNKGYRSTVCVPFMVDGSVVAAIILYAAERDFFDAEELALLNEVAADVSLALQGIEKQKKLEYLSYYDVLTGLPNRALFQETLKKTLSLATGKGWLVAVLYIDLDNFKNVNDTLGHGIGDELLVQFGSRLLQCVRIRDTVGRLGGDEFALILLMEEGQEGAARVAAKVRDALSVPFDLKGHTVTTTASIGITIHPADASDPETLMKYADTAMYRAKQAGRDTFRFFTPQMNIEVVARLETETALRHALDNGEFILHYQPKVQLNTGRIAGVEALLRWQRPGHGMVPPNAFIPVLEDSGLIVRVGRWVIAEACRQIGLWLRSSIGAVQISVNISGRQFSEGDLQGDVSQALADNNIPADLLELELTETSLMADTERTIGILRDLKKQGVEISIDDFGTGYSSLAYLSRFPIDKLKIDIAFIRDVTSNPDHAAIVLAIIRMGQGLKLEVIAEGVETEAQLAYLRRHQCDAIQGYYFSRPLPQPELETILLEKKSLPGPEGETGKPLKTLLLVDDDVNVLEMLQRMLRHDRYQILSARSAPQGFEMLALHPVQVIVCDQRMDGMNGTDFLDRVKDLYPDTFRIILSGYTDTEALLDAVNCGAIHRFYTKPWNDKALRESILDAFRRYRLLHDARVSRHARDPDDTLPPRRMAASLGREKLPAPLLVKDEP